MRLLKTGFLLVLGLSTTVFFQNCSVTRFSSSASNAPQGKDNGSNGGFDGKPYIHFGICKGVANSVASLAQLSTDGTQLQVLRENCEDLPAPYPNRIAELTVKNQSGALLVLNERDLYDMQTNAQEQIATLHYCRATSDLRTGPVEAQVWTHENSQDGLSGRILDVDPGASLGYGGSSSSTSNRGGISPSNQGGSVGASMGNPGPASTFDSGDMSALTDYVRTSPSGGNGAGSGSFEILSGHGTGNSFVLTITSLRNENTLQYTNPETSVSYSGINCYGQLFSKTLLSRSAVPTAGPLGKAISSETQEDGP